MMVLGRSSPNEKKFSGRPSAVRSIRVSGTGSGSVFGRAFEQLMKSDARTTTLAVRVIPERGLLIRFFQPTFACTEAFYLLIGLVDYANCCKQAISGFDRWSLSVKAILRQPRPRWLLPDCARLRTYSHPFDGEQ